MTYRDDEDDEADELLQDPYVQEAIEHALAPYVGTAPPELLRAMRETLEVAMTTHPYAVGIVKQLRARRAPLISGEEPIGEAPPEDSARAGGGRGGRGGRS